MNEIDGERTLTLEVNQSISSTLMLSDNIKKIEKEARKKKF